MFPIRILLIVMLVPTALCFVSPYFTQQQSICSQSQRKITSSTRHLHLLSTPSQQETQKQGNGKQRKANNTRRGGRPQTNIQSLRKKTNELISASSSSRSPNSLSTKIKVNKRAFNNLIDLWAFSGSPDAAQNALTLLHCMESHPSITPDVRSYTKVINALSRSNLPTSGDKAEQILEKMKELATSGQNPSAKPNTYTFTAVIEAWSNSHRGGEGAHRAEVICRRMQRIFEEEGDEGGVKPTARSFNAVISAWAKSGEIGAAQKAEDMLDEMERLYAKGDNPDVKPNSFNYNAVMNAWAKMTAVEAKNAAEHIEGVLQRMKLLYEEGDEGMKPTAASYNTVISAYARMGEAEKAEDILWEMEKVYEETGDEDVKPNVKTFNSVINAWAKSREDSAADRAEQILTNMQHLYSTGKSDIRPDVTTFTTVINAWARSHNFGKAAHAKKILQQMIEAQQMDQHHQLLSTGSQQRTLAPTAVIPNTIIYNSVMNACAFTIGDETEQSQAMEIAHGTYKELEDSPYGSPDEITYGTFLKVCANQMPDDEARSRVVDVVFRKCRGKGLVGDLVLQQLKIVAGEGLYRKLVGRERGESVRVEDLPLEWTCNVRRGRRSSSTRRF